MRAPALGRLASASPSSPGWHIPTTGKAVKMQVKSTERSKTCLQINLHLLYSGLANPFCCAREYTHMPVPGMSCEKFAGTTARVLQARLMWLCQGYDRVKPFLAYPLVVNPALRPCLIYFLGFLAFGASDASRSRTLARLLVSELPCSQQVLPLARESCQDCHLHSCSISRLTGPQSWPDFRDQDFPPPLDKFGWRYLLDNATGAWLVFLPSVGLPKDTETIPLRAL